MKVRTKFTLWIALVSFSAALLFSVFVFFEMLDEGQNLLRRELIDTADSIIRTLPQKGPAVYDPEKNQYPLERYFIKVFADGDRVIYASSLAADADIAKRPSDGFSEISLKLDPQSIWRDPLEDDDFEKIDDDTVKFLLYQHSGNLNEIPATVLIAKPLAVISKEIRELFHELSIYIILTTVIIVMASYFLAGRLLSPIAGINRRIKTIRENSLDERIPLGKSEDELYTLSQSLNLMFDRLQNSFQKQKDFISNASHEMKIPLTVAMLGHEELLGRDLPDGLRREINRQLTNLHRLSRLVKDLLDISHLEHREFIDKKGIALPLLIERVLEDFDEMLAASGIDCTVKLERLNVAGDYDKLTRVFINLIDNAVKYNSQQQGRILVCSRKEGEWARISVENSGREIPAEDLPHIFEQFYRVEKSRAAHYGGTGLGLTIVKRIIELHGGTVEASSSGGKTVIGFTLPLA